MAVEQGVADHQRGTTVSLFAAGLRIERHHDEVPFLGDLPGYPLPCFLADGRTPVLFRDAAIVRHVGNQRPQIMSSARGGRRFDDEAPVPDRDANLIAHVNADLLEQGFRDAEPLTVSPTSAPW